MSDLGTLAAGLAVVWGGLAAYLLYLHRAQAALRRDVELLESRLGEGEE